MCKHGTDRMVEQSRLPGGEYRDKERLIPIDECIADIVLALNDGGVHTKACCCGHGHPPGEIILCDDRVLLILEPGQCIEYIKMCKEPEPGDQLNDKKSGRAK